MNYLYVGLGLSLYCVGIVTYVPFKILNVVNAALHD